MRILRITFANLRKKKAAVISLGILIILAALLLDIGLNLLMNAGDIMLERTEALHGPHFVMICGGNYYQPEYKTFFEENPRVSEVEVESAVSMDGVKTMYGSGEMELAAVFQNIEAGRSILPFVLLEGEEVPAQDSIYLPVGIKDGSPAIGEPFPVTYKNKTYTFQVAGYFETPVYGTANTGIIKYYLSEEAYLRLSDEIGVNKLISVRLHNPLEADALKSEFKSFTDGELNGDDLSSLSQLGSTEIRYVGTTMPNIFSASLIGVAVIILAVVALVAKFRISASIEDNIHNIGALEAIGYTSGQIMLSVLLEFGILALAGAIAGVLLGSAALPALGRMLTSVSGVIWNGTTALVPNLMSILIMPLAVMGVTAADALKVRRLTPVVALRGGIMTHSFHRNRFPLDRRGSLIPSLACKYACLNPPQNILLGAVMAGVTFIMILGVLLYTNLAKDQTAIIRMSGVEFADVVVHLTRHTDAELLKKQLLNREGVKKISMADMIVVEVEGEDTVTTAVSDDFDNMETMNVYEGDFPRYENEVAVSGAIAERQNKEIGDAVKISYGGVTAEYIITGLTQCTSLGGKMCFMPLKSIRRLDPYYLQGSINLYLEEGVEPEAFMDELEQDYSVLPVAAEEENGDSYGGIEERIREKMANLLTMYAVDSVQYAMMKDGKLIFSGSSEDYKIERLENYRLKIQAQIYPMSAMFQSLTQVIVIFSVFIIGIILNMLIRGMIRKWQKEFGIQKSLGFTSGQLSAQIVGSILPAAITGIVAGALLGSLFAKSVFLMMFNSVGVMSMMLQVSPWTITGICISVLFVALLCAFASAGRIRRISVYSLITE